ncbi:hypothetical protein [Oceanobacillus manasiensis]|uniref:hypothetical protein n=1 Tax=Oceanobacillus manasiensis TaxID=586413 RepID=UPI0005A67B1A|nr:hypothetical protein [Oceanobacillus manasiensis]
MKQTGVKIDGVIYSLDGNLGHNELLDDFFKSIEGIGWHFGGGSYQVDEESRQIEDIDQK